ncbi:MAG: hypothetical protein MJ237_02630 [bacterium]|nr:hypothetical protein [bacterium]
MYERLKFCLARESLRYLVKTYNINKIYIPYYLCNVIRHTLMQENCKPIFYHIDSVFMPNIEFKKDEYILYPNYFGICDRNVEILEQKYPKLIVDNAHSYYSSPKGFACFNSERKFRNVVSGSDLWIKKEGVSQKDKMSFKILPKERFMKFCFYHEKYSDVNLLKIDLKSVSSPFCYPYLASDDMTADLTVSELEKNGLRIYRYWDNLPKSYNEYKFYRRLVPIPLLP